MIDIGSAIGPYKVTKKQGEDGMGAIFSAAHAGNDRQVTIKVLHPEFAKVQDLSNRFLNEARAVNRIDHSGVVKVIDYGQLPDGTAYIVMESLRGESMADKLKQRGGPLPLGTALNYGRQLAATLAVAHEKGIVHRDIKPDNVLLVADANAPGGEQTKLLDFGIAKLTSEASAAGVKTRTSALMGTPHFMSPEQCKGGKNADEKSDVYSLGVLLFVMLTGSYPFDAEGVGDIIGKHLFEPPPTVKSIAPDVPDSLSQLVARLLAKSKDDRPKMYEVRDALGVMQSSAPLPESGRPKHVSPAEPAEKRHTNALPIVPPPGSAMRGRGLLLAATGLLLLSALTAGWLAIHPASNADSQGSRDAAPPTAQLRIDSIPSNAEVVRKIDGKVLGRTPWKLDHPVATDDLVVILRLPGYADREVSLPQSMDSVRSVVLSAAEASAETPSVPPEKTGKRGRKNKAEAQGGVAPGRGRSEEE